MICADKTQIGRLTEQMSLSYPFFNFYFTVQGIFKRVKGANKYICANFADTIITKI